MEKSVILENKVIQKWNNGNKKHYIDLGYKFTKLGDEFEISINHLTTSSMVKVLTMCPYCKKERYLEYRKAIKSTCCRTCARKHANDEKMKNLCCSECGKKQDFYRYFDGKPYCNTHWSQMNTVGFCYKSQYERNDIEIFDTYAEIILRDKHGKEHGRALIDIEDVEKVKDVKWRLYKAHHTSYVYGFSTEKRVLKLHRLIMNCPSGLVVDHLNHNGLDNRKINLRVCTIKENNMNRRRNIEEGSEKS